MNSSDPRHPTPALSVVLPLAMALGFASACEAPIRPSDEPPPLIEARVEAGYPTLDGPCQGPVAEPTHLVVTSTDFNTGAVGLVDLGTRTVAPDLAGASSDAIPFAIGERVFVVNRWGFDYIDELDPRAALELVYEWPLAPAVPDSGPANLQTLALDPAGRGWVSLLGAGELQQIEFPTLAAAQPHAALSVDLRGFADADGIPELSAIVACGSTLFVVAERVDRTSWTPADETYLIPLGTGDEPTLFDWDPARPGPDAIQIGGAGFGRWRLDPADPSAHTIVALNSGLERIDLAAGTREWLVDEALFADANYDRLQLASWDWDASGQIWITAATPDFAEYRLLRVDFSGAEPSLIVEVEGLHSVTGSLEIVGDEAWIADTTIGASGLRGFDLGASPVAELPESPLAVGLPPMSLAPLQL